MPSDCPRLAELFYQTVHEVNKQDYTKEQLNAWASGKVDLDAWNRSFLEHYTLIAVEEGEILGFGDIDEPDIWTVCTSIKIIREKESPPNSVTNWRPMFRRHTNPCFYHCQTFFSKERL